MKLQKIFLPFAFLLFTCLSNAQTLAPGAPGKDAQWASAGKQAIGTSASLESKVWFTLEGGAMTEVYYPDVTMANVHLLQFVVVNPKTKKVETERDDANHEIKVSRPDSLSFQQINTAQTGEWKITKTYTTDIKRNTVLIDVRFETQNQDLNLYVYFDSSLGNSGMHDSAFSDKDFLYSKDGDKSVAVVFTSKIEEETSGFYQTSDGLEQLKQFGKIVNQHKKAEKGNVTQMAKIKQPKQFTAILSFANDFKKSFIKIDSANIAILQGYKSRSKGFTKAQAEYDKEWSDYVKTLPKIEPKYQAQFNMAAMVLKASEDKTVRGANVASLTIPWGGGANANEDVGGGYHLVWSRDLYQVVTAYMALNDLAAANRALDFLFNIQQKADGSFPQNSWLDGKPSWNSLQLDEVAYPLILAYQLKRFDKRTYENHVKKAADFIVKTGPKTVQERWEEKSGYSPSTIAAEIAGLVCAAEIAKKNGDEASATIYLATADDWARNIERWTATTKGKYGDGNYYLRLTENGTPNAGEKTVLNNNAGTFLESEIVDAGFLELVRFGIKSPDDPLILKSVKVIDQVLRVNTPNGEGFYRYNHDGYGEMDDGRRWNWDGKYTGKGRLWALLSGERGQYEIAECGTLNAEKGGSPRVSKGANACNEKAKKRLDAMLGFANEGLMIPEQVWDKPETPKNIDKQFIPELKFGEGTGSATPLAWSMAQFIRLAVNLQAGRNLETPDVVYNRYVLGKKSEIATTISQPNPSFSGLPIQNNFSSPLPNCFSEWRSRQSVLKQSDLAKVLNKNPVIWNCKNGKNLAVFVYRGDAEEVKIAGDFTSWKPSEKIFRNFSDDSKVKVYSLEFAPSARVEYKLIIDGNWITDPLNPNKIDNGVGSENSFFTMPNYKPTVWDKGELPKLEEFDLNTKNFGSRKIKVYLPLNYANSNAHFPVLHLEDGTEYFNKTRAAVQQENLVKAGKVKPFIIVFIDPKDRMKEYWANDAWADFVADELVPEIDKKYRTIQNRDGRALLGASLGGVTSVWIALKHPEKFARVGGQSSSFWIDNQRVIKELEELDSSKAPFYFYFDTGTLEEAENSRRVNVMLRGKGFPVAYEEGETGHNWTAWRNRLAAAFTALWK